MDESLAANAEDLDGEFTAAPPRLGRRARRPRSSRGWSSGRTRGGSATRSSPWTDPGSSPSIASSTCTTRSGRPSREWIEPGELGPAATFAVGALTFGLMTCYDLRFPEVARTLVDAGADALVVPAEWVRGPLKEQHWTTLLAARAIESTAYVVAADHPTPIGVGHSVVIDPQGVAIAGVGTGRGDRGRRARPGPGRARARGQPGAAAAPLPRRAALSPLRRRSRSPARRSAASAMTSGRLQAAKRTSPR